MNYLQLVNDFMIETDMDDQLTTVVSQTDDALKASIWVRDAWTQIQRSERWSFMWGAQSFSTVVSQTDYSLSMFDYDSSSFRNDTTEVYLQLVTVNSIRYTTATGDVTSIAQYPDFSIRVHPIPAAIQTIGYDGWADPVILAADTDTPTMDSAFHKAIVWLAISNYAREQGSEWNGLYVTANREFKQIYATMTNRYLPTLGPKVGLIR